MQTPRGVSPATEVSVLSSIGSDELRVAGRGSAGNDELLHGILAGCGDCIKILDLDGRLHFMSEGGLRAMEIDDFAKVKGCPWPEFWEGTNYIDAVNAIDTAKAGGRGWFKGTAYTAKGTPRHWDVQVLPIRGSDGKPSHLLSISRDITDELRAFSDLKEAVQRQALLAAELQHRIKNTLAMVAAIANQTMCGDDVDAAREAFVARLMTLSHAHDILTQTSWSDAPIREIVNGALAPHRPGRGCIRVSGPNLVLQSRQALALAVAIHELATNATKYGALSTGGRVDVAWSVAELETVPHLRFTWTESGGPQVSKPAPNQRGFGSRLIEQILGNTFAGKVTTSYRPDGVECELIAPLSFPNDPTQAIRTMDGKGCAPVGGPPAAPSGNTNPRFQRGRQS
jgi:two-component sensor histidine kinase